MAVLKEAAILNGPLARLSRWPPYPLSDSDIVKDEAWCIDTVPSWMSTWLRELTLPGKDPVIELHGHLSGSCFWISHSHKVAYLKLVVAALTLKDSWLNLSIQIITGGDDELADLLPTRWLPGEWLSELSKLPYIEGFSPTDDALVDQARKGQEKQVILAGRVKETFLCSLPPQYRFPVSQPPSKLVGNMGSNEANPVDQSDGNSEQ